MLRAEIFSSPALRTSYFSQISFANLEITGFLRNPFLENFSV